MVEEQSHLLGGELLPSSLKNFLNFRSQLIL